ncbi:MAG TPA: efflux RND transporter periplasmic adaptor subunit [Bryobacteraceae bacterium]|nr:efflux RND transporter periplasmic adaptor subunit [Bryobacteraceae bacterium]
MATNRCDVGLGVALSVICLASGCGRQNPVPSETIRPVKTMLVEKGAEIYVRTLPGRVEAARSAELAFQVPGLVTKLPVKEGQHVTRGQVVGQLRQTEYQARREAAKGQLQQGLAVLDTLRSGARSEEQLRREAALRAAEAKLENAHTEIERYTRLLPTSAVSRSEYELSQTNYRVAEEERQAAQQLLEKARTARQEEIDAQEAQVHTLEARVREAGVQLADTTLRAPYSGVVAQRLIDEGEAITANKPAVKFQNTEEIDIVADVPEAIMAADLRSGNVNRMTAEFSHMPGKQFPVRISEIAQVADPATQTFQARFRMKPPPRTVLLPGMTAVVDIAFRRPRAQAHQTFVPISAVTREANGRQVVWVLGANQTVRCREVRLGEVKDGKVEIRDGLRPGERIAVAGAEQLREGMKVRDLGNALGGM